MRRGGVGAIAGETQTGVRVMTPEVAAPEQVRGGAISTATDVYALGILLYLLVTGERPYDLRGKSPSGIVEELPVFRLQLAEPRIARLDRRDGCRRGRSGRGVKQTGG